MTADRNVCPTGCLGLVEGDVGVGVLDVGEFGDFAEDEVVEGALVLDVEEGAS